MAYTNNKSKCDFCVYKSNGGCMVTPNSYYCKNAIEEYRQYLQGNTVVKQKSLRSWDKNR